MDIDPTSLQPLPRRFFDAPLLELAAALLGQWLVRRERGGALTVGTIVEVEAYGGAGIDDAAHSFRGPTPRCAVMFGPPGRAYVYATQGRCCCLNVSAGEEGNGQAVLLRALEAVAGQPRMRRRRLARLGQGPTRRALLAGGDDELCRGPGRLCLSLAVDRRLDGCDLTDDQGALFLARGQRITSAEQPLWTPRIGLNPQLSAHDWPWRALRPESLAVSGPRVARP